MENTLPLEAKTEAGRATKVITTAGQDRGYGNRVDAPREDKLKIFSR